MQNSHFLDQTKSAKRNTSEASLRKRVRACLFLKKFADPNFMLSGKFVQNFFSEIPVSKLIVLNKNKDFCFSYFKSTEYNGLSKLL
jgi:hypothetical protein